MSTDTVSLYPYADSSTSERLKLEISRADLDKFKRIPRMPNQEPAQVYDHTTQKHYWVRPACCGADCFCAAEVVTRQTKDVWA